MASIGLDKLHFALQTQDDVTFSAPVPVPGAVKAEITVESASARLDADDRAFEQVDEFVGGTITLEISELTYKNEIDILDAIGTGSGTNNTYIYKSAEDAPPYVAVGFRCRLANGRYRYYWVYKVKFGQPNISVQTKGENITFSTTTLTGTILAVSDGTASGGRHPWMIRHDQTPVGTDSIADGWFGAVYKPMITSSNVMPDPLSDDPTPLTVTSAEGSEGNKTVITYTGYVPSAAESLVYKLTDDAVDVRLDDVLTAANGWTAWDGESEITAINGKRITLAVIETETGKCKAAGFATVAAPSQDEM